MVIKTLNFLVLNKKKRKEEKSNREEVFLPYIHDKENTGFMEISKKQKQTD